MKKNTLKKIFISLAFALTGSAVSAQGLENVIVETYYVADVNDNAFSGANGDGILPIGSVTYRLYVDMLPGYKFEALYGVPGHPLNLNSSLPFFNNEDRGSTTPNWTKVQGSHNTVMLDSWFSVGAACNGQVGVLKADDNGVANVVNTDGILQNTIGMGIPLTAQDGMKAGTPQPVTYVGLSVSDLDVFDGVSLVGNSFTTSNGSIASLNGSYGADTLTNRVLVGQFTTAGDFCFNLNIQIGTPGGGYENWVAATPLGNEMQAQFLNYCSATVNVNKFAPAADETASVYPNPATDAFTIDINSTNKTNSNSYRIFDMVGNLITEKKLGAVSGKYSETVDISSFAKGIYFIEINLGQEKSTKKLIKY